MSSNESYNALRELLEKKREEYRAAKKRMAHYEGLLERLKPVKKEISSLKYAFLYDVKKPDAHNKESDLWVGEQYRGFQRDIEALESENDNYYRGSLDYILDALNDEITRVENLYLAEQGLVGRLAGVINSLANEVENFFN